MGTSFARSLGIVCGLLLGASAGAADAKPFQGFLPQGSPIQTLTLPMVQGDQVRVLIFPHHSTNPPQGRDTVVDRVTLSTTGRCLLREARLNPPGPLPGTGAGTEFQRREFLASALTLPVWVECPDPVRVERAANLPNYRYTGSFLIRALNAKVVEVIQVMSMETYLRGVVPIEMPPTWPAEALRAQAVAARTYAWFHVANSRLAVPDRPYDMDDTVQYQAYTGLENQTPSTDWAVDSTYGLTLFYQGEVIQAFFSADSGGHTEDASNVWPQWGEVPYCVGKPEIYTDADLDLNRWGPWKSIWTWKALTDRLRERGRIGKGDEVVGFEVPEASRLASGRAGRVIVRLKKGTTAEFEGTDFRRMLGLRSTRFQATIDAQGVTLEGRGHGHGVGMSQLGAMTLAGRYGWDFRRILEFYYTGVRIEPKR